MVDTGVLLAGADRGDPAHESCRELLETHSGPPLTTELVLAETGWLLDRQLGPAAEATLYRSVGNGEIVVEHLSRADWIRVAELTGRYADQHLGGVDAGLIAVAERLGLTTIASLDRRHFGIVRPKHVKALDLVPSRSQSVRPSSVPGRHCPVTSSTPQRDDERARCAPTAARRGRCGSGPRTLPAPGCRPLREHRACYGLPVTPGVARVRPPALTVPISPTRKRSPGVC